jgi:GNAT superfamily N-acetyltransferase
VVVPAVPPHDEPVVAPAATPAAWEEVGRLIRAYLASLGFSVAFQDLDAELADPASQYGPPDGLALLARLGGGPAVGFTGIRPLDRAAGVSELKRMYLDPSARGRGLGRALAEAAVAGARDLGYRRVLLDSRRSLVEACALYRSLGFVDVAPYRHNPFDDAVFLALDV